MSAVRQTRRRLVLALDRIGMGKYARAAKTALSSRDERRNIRDDRGAILIASTFLGPADVCVDVGAHTGSFLSSVVSIAPEATHIAYEPLPDYAASLRARFPCVDVREAAVSDRSGEIAFLRDLDSPARSGFARWEDHSVEPLRVRTVKLDDEDLLPALVKIDVEGAEMRVLRGAYQTLCMKKPILIFEHGTAARRDYGVRSEELFELLSEIGYAIRDFRGGLYRTPSEFADADAWNFWANTPPRTSTSMSQ